MMVSRSDAHHDLEQSLKRDHTRMSLLPFILRSRCHTLKRLRAKNPQARSCCQLLLPPRPQRFTPTSPIYPASPTTVSRPSMERSTNPLFPPKVGPEILCPPFHLPPKYAELPLSSSNPSDQRALRPKNHPPIPPATLPVPMNQESLPPSSTHPVSTSPSRTLTIRLLLRPFRQMMISL
jgi:hypothetical protein